MTERQEAIMDCVAIIEARATKLRAKATQQRRPTTAHYFDQVIELRNVAGTLRALAMKSA